MSNYKSRARRPLSVIWEDVDMLDNFYGGHKYGVRFPDATVYEEKNCSFCPDDMHEENINNFGYCAMCSNYENEEKDFKVLLQFGKEELIHLVIKHRQLEREIASKISELHILTMRNIFGTKNKSVLLSKLMGLIV